MAKGDQEVKQVTAPWTGQQSFLTDIYNQAQQAFGQTSQVPYGGDFIARPANQQLGALNEATATAAALPRDLGNPAISLGSSALAGNFLDPNSNPAFQSAADAALAPVTRAYTQNIIPGIKNKSISEGAYGGSRNDLALGEAGRGFAQESLDITNKMAFDQYNKERLYQQTAPDLISQGLGLQFSPSDYMGAVGGQQRGYTQDAIQNELLKLQEALSAPWRGMSEYSGVVQQGAPGSSSTTTSPGTTPFAGAIQGGLGGAALGANLYNAMGSTGDQNLWAGIPGILGALGGFFG